MSIIHDALKKAQQSTGPERGRAPGDTGQGVGAGKSSRVLAGLAIGVGILALVVTAWRVVGTISIRDQKISSLQATASVPRPRPVGPKGTVNTAVAPEKEQQYDTLARQAERLFWLGDLTGAEKAFKNALLESNTNDPELLNNLGLVLMKKGDLDQALELLDRAVQGDPGLVEALCNRAVVYRRMELYPKAKSDLEKALSIAPDHGHSQFNLATVYEAMGQKKEAIMYYRKYLGNPDRAPGLDEALIHQRVSTLEAEVTSVSWPMSPQKKGR